MSFSNASVALVHGMARPIGAYFHKAHGISNAVLLPHVMEWSLPGAPGRFAEIARALGADTTGLSEAAGRRACRHRGPGPLPRPQHPRSHRPRHRSRETDGAGAHDGAGCSGQRQPGQQPPRPDCCGDRGAVSTGPIGGQRADEKSRGAGTMAVARVRHVPSDAPTSTPSTVGYSTAGHLKVTIGHFPAMPAKRVSREKARGQSTRSPEGSLMTSLQRRKR